MPDDNKWKIFNTEIRKFVESFLRTLPSFSPSVYSVYSEKPSAERSNYVEDYEQTFHAIVVLRSIFRNLYILTEEVLSALISFEQRKPPFSVELFDKETYRIYYPQLQQEIYILVNLFRDRSRITIPSLKLKYPEMMYAYFLRNEMIQHPSFQNTFDGFLLPRTSLFELIHRHYSSLITDQKFLQMTDEEKRKENRAFFLNKNWPSPTKEPEEYYKFKAFGLANIDFVNLESDFKKFCEDVVFPFVHSTIDRGRRAGYLE
jgi:hypothetical protein